MELEELLDHRSFFGLADRAFVRAELLRRLVDKYGMVYLDKNGEPSVVDYVMSLRDQAPFVRILSKISDYGGREGVAQELAAALEPFWQRWWSRLFWTNSWELSSSVSVMDKVLGERQMRWIAAQAARTTLDALSSDPSRDAALLAIGSVEEWSVDPTKDRESRMYESGMRLVRYRRLDAPAAVSASLNAVLGATSASWGVEPPLSAGAVAFDRTISSVAGFLASSVPGGRITDSGLYRAMADTCDFVRSSFSPTLIVRPSKAGSSGLDKPMSASASALAGVALGALAVHALKKQW